MRKDHEDFPINLFSLSSLGSANVQQCNCHIPSLLILQDVPPPPPPGISMEEADELKENIERLEEEVVELKAKLAAKEDANNKLSE